jgi:hypothetical protein
MFKHVLNNQYEFMYFVFKHTMMFKHLLNFNQLCLNKHDF